jgi:hypothetical protein
VEEEEVRSVEIDVWSKKGRGVWRDKCSGQKKPDS